MCNPLMISDQHTGKDQYTDRLYEFVETSKITPDENMCFSIGW